VILSPEQLCPDQPELAAEMARFIAAAHRLLDLSAAAQDSSDGLPPTQVTSSQSDDPPTLSRLPPVPDSDSPARVPAPAPPRPGNERPGAGPPGYEIIEELGRGNMGVVYRAVQKPLNRVVALKMVLSGGHATAQDRRRFLTEAEAIAAVRHPGIVQVYDYGTHDGLPYFSMELCEGGSLAGRLAESPLPPHEAARLVEQVARAVQAAHDAGIVHRDLKPANVLLASSFSRGSENRADAARFSEPRLNEETALDGVSVKVTDFGLAKRVESAAGLTATGAVMGTPSYMAPEQALGKKEVGPAADTYAVGAILYDCLTGRPPFKAATVFETLQQVVNDEPVPPRHLNPRVPVDIETIVLKCLHKEPAARYTTAAALADDLDRFLAGEPIAARPAGRIERAVKWARRRPTAASLLGVSVLAVLALVLLSGVALWQWQRASTALENERDARHKEDQERTRRALAQVEALLSADPRTVPAILANLAEQRDDVLPRLRQVWAEPDTPAHQPRRLRAALALLAVEPNRVREALIGWMLEVPDPAELIIVREALRPHAGELRSGLWKQLESAKLKPQRGLRLLAALAAFDPRGVGWKKVDEKALAPWLDDNPLYLGAWIDAFRDARTHLLTPLTRVFHNGTAERRPAAASILADYAKDQPRTLVDLITRADDRQFAALLPALEQQRGRVVPLLEGEVRRKEEPTWNDGSLKSSWLPATAEVTKQLEQARGIIAERFALVQTLPLEKGPALVADLARSGYRLACYRPYRRGRELLVAAVWQRDGQEVVMEQGLTTAALRQRDAQLRQKGHVPLDVSLYPAEGVDHHAAVWIRKDASTLDARLYAGPVSEHRAAWTRLQTEGYVPRTQTWTAPDGKPRRLAAVWWKPSRPLAENVHEFDRDKAWYEDNLSPDRLQIDVRLVAGDPLLAARAWRQEARDQLARNQMELASKSDNLNALFRRAEARYWLGQHDSALADFDTFIKRTPDAVRSYGYRALLHARAGRGSQARSDLEQYLKRGNATEERAATQALVAVYLGEEQRGLQELEAALTRQAPGGAGSYHAARVHSQAVEVIRGRQVALAAALAGAPSLPGALMLARVVAEPAQQRADRAVELLRQALAAGWATPGSLLADADLEPLHSHPGFVALLRHLHLDRRYSAVWHDSIQHNSEQSHGLAPGEHLEQCRTLAAQGYRPVAISVAETTAGQPLATASVWHRPVIGEAARETLARRQSGAALALARLGQWERVWPLLSHSPYPEARTRLLARLGPNGVPGHTLVERLQTEKDVSVRQALLLALGEYTAEQLPADWQQRLVPRLLAWYRADPDPGIRGAIDFLLRHNKEGPADRPLDWGQARTLEKIDEDLAARRRAERAAAVAAHLGALAGGGLPSPQVEPIPGDRGWYINGQGQTLTVIDARQPFLMGSPGDEKGRIAINERLHWRQIGRRYAIGTKPVSVAQFERFLKAHPEIKHSSARSSGSPPGVPITRVTWYEAAQYCRWLSEQEGFPEHEMVYPTVAEIQKCKDGETPRRMPVNYLSRRGYRLPTEAEWEYACRAGARTSRYYGSSLELLPRYAWFQSNSDDRPWPVGQKRPNDLGLFDMHGNVWTWCQESAWQYPQGSRERPVREDEDKREITRRLARIIRGAAFVSRAAYVRSADRSFYAPTNRGEAFGIRVARTLP
jgi:serine/threonine protein kinase/formylglycine-generating enzyme required for sulfatase activity/tetratricopeptide (TPR) repeat protein